MKIRAKERVRARDRVKVRVKVRAVVSHPRSSNRQIIEERESRAKVTMSVVCAPS